MYAEAGRVNPDSLYELALRTYREMLAAGYTTVGEFHYVHHQPSGQPYAEFNAMSEALLQAGREAGIRVVLLMTAYAQAGFNQPPEESQRRFCDASVEAYLSRVETLRAKGVPIGVAPHSVRAVPEHWFRAIANYSRTHHLPLHVHAGEQIAEIEQCCADYGTRAGAKALGIETGLVAPAMSADFIAVDINHPAMAGWNTPDFLDVLFFGASSEVIRQTWVKGKRVWP